MIAIKKSPKVAKYAIYYHFPAILALYFSEMAFWRHFGDDEIGEKRGFSRKKRKK